MRINKNHAFTMSKKYLFEHFFHYGAQICIIRAAVLRVEHARRILRHGDCDGDGRLPYPSTVMRRQAFSANQISKPLITNENRCLAISIFDHKPLVAESHPSLRVTKEKLSGCKKNKTGQRQSGVRIPVFDGTMEHFQSTATKETTPNTKRAFFASRKTREGVAEKQRDAIRKEVYLHNEYEFVETETRNCLLCGRTRSGKTTTMGVLKDPCYSPKGNNIFSETQNPKFQSFSINNRAETAVQKFTINIIDSPGLFEVKDMHSIDAERTNEVIAQTIAKCLENEITNIHCIVMFLTFEAGINRDDIAAMKVFLDMFGGCGVSVALCVTHADKHNDKWRTDIEEQLLRHPEISTLVKQENMSVLFMGCVNTDDKAYYDEESLMEDYKSVYEMRQKLLELIFAAQEKRLLNQMNVAKKKIEQVEAVMDIIIDNYKLFTATNDFATQRVQETIIQHKENIQYLSENSVYMNVPELADKFVNLLEAAQRFKTKDMDPQLKNSLLWPLKLREEKKDSSIS